jgi:hypothetical protein
MTTDILYLICGLLSTTRQAGWKEMQGTEFHGDAFVNLWHQTSLAFILNLDTPDMSHNSSVSKKTGYLLHGQSSIPGRGRDLSPFHHVQTVSEAHPASY